MMNLILRDILQLLLIKPKIDCTQEQTIKEFRSILPVINQVWVQFENEKKGALKWFLIFILDNYMIQCPSICELISIMLSISPATGPLERSYMQSWQKSPIKTDM